MMTFQTRLAPSLKRGVNENRSNGLSLTLTEAGSVRGERLRLHSPREREHVAPPGLKTIKSKITIRIKSRFQPRSEFNY